MTFLIVILWLVSGVFVVSRVFKCSVKEAAKRLIKPSSIPRNELGVVYYLVFLIAPVLFLVKFLVIGIKGTILKSEWDSF